MMTYVAIAVVVFLQILVFSTAKKLAPVKVKARNQRKATPKQ